MALTARPKNEATVVITTKNRKEDLLNAIVSALAQTVRPEVIVMDDGSTDGTAEFILAKFPEIRLERSEHSLGYIRQRNRAARLASHPILFSIDDDAVFSSPLVVEQTLREFDHPRVGAVAIPFVDVNKSPEIHHRAPSAEGVYAGYAYIGTAHALRRDLFLRLSGYREILFHQSEEEDYCIRLLNAGYVTRYGCADPVHHFESPRRSWTRMDYYGARNKVLYACHNVPMPNLAVHLTATTFFTSIYARSPARFVTRLRGVAGAYSQIGLGRIRRQPVARSVYRLSRELKRRGAVRLDEIESRLPQPAF
jgi:glycosyltransferase involved in cell wall biosynthesis